MVNFPSTKFEDPTAIHSGVMSSDISHSIPLTMRLQPLRMRRITWAMRRCKCFPHVWNPWPRLAYSLYNFFGVTIKIKRVIWQNSVWPCVKTTQLFAHAQNHASLERCRKSFTTIVLGDHHFPLTASKFGNLAAFRAILAIFSLRMRRNGYFWTSGYNSDITIRFLDPDLLMGHGMSAIWERFLLIFAFDKLNIRHISTSGLVDLLI